MRSTKHLFQAIAATTKRHIYYSTKPKEVIPPAPEKTPRPTHQENLKWMQEEIKKIKPGDYTILDSSGLKEAYDEAMKNKLPGVY